MAQKTIVTLVDDVTGEEVTDGSGQTIQIGWQGKLYEMDVSGDTYASMEEYFNDVLANARVIRGQRTNNTDPAAPQKKARSERIGRIREWAKEQGMEIADRGRINKDVLEAYASAHPEDVDDKAA